MVRRVGKSPPGGAMSARPRRASSGPMSSTDPRNRPTRAAVRLVLGDLAAADPQGGRADAVDLGAEIEEEPAHDLDVRDARHVIEHALVGCEQTGGNQRQRGILVAFDVHPSAQPMPAFDDQC